MRNPEQKSGKCQNACQDEGGDRDEDDPGNAHDGRHTQDDVEGAVDRELGVNFAIRFSISTGRSVRLATTLC